MCVVAMSSVTSTAFAEDTPLSLTVSQNLRHDSNLLRSTNAQSDTVSTTAVQADFNKAYGRQTYRASARVARSNYNRFESLDNDARALSVGLVSDFGANWQATINGSLTTSLNAPQDNPANNRLLRNVRDFRDVGGTLQYGLGGRWAIIGSYNNNRFRFSEDSAQFRNSDQESAGLRAVYAASDLVSFGFGPRLVTTRFPENLANPENKDRNLDFTVNWRVTGLSNLNLLLSRRNTTVEQTTGSDRTINAFTGSLGWNYTPRGLLSYGVSLTRATNADRFQNTQNFTLGTGSTSRTLLAVQNVAADTISTSLNLSSTARLTGKVSTALSYGYTRFERTNDRSRSSTGVAGADQLIGNNASSSSSSSRLQSMAWSVSYAAYRWLGVNCTLQYYDQTPDVNRPKFQGRSVDCGANFTLDP
jgi:hypothetical protein